MKFIFAYFGFGAAAILTVIDLVTSWMGINTLVPEGNESLILMVVPVAVACMSLAFNATSSYLLILFREQETTGLSKIFLLVIWLCFLVFDGVSSWLGLLSCLHEGSIGTLNEIAVACRGLDGAQNIMCLSVAVLATAGPFLATVFWDLASAGGLSISTLFR